MSVAIIIGDFACKMLLFSAGHAENANAKAKLGQHTSGSLDDSLVCKGLLHESVNSNVLEIISAFIGRCVDSSVSCKSTRSSSSIGVGFHVSCVGHQRKVDLVKRNVTLAGAIS